MLWRGGTLPRGGQAGPLSNAAHEVLACALYLGPLTRGAISRVRGVNSDAVVRNLLERGLLAEVGTDHDAPGSPSLLGVTDEFLAAGSSSSDDFPPLGSWSADSPVHERLTSATTHPGRRRNPVVRLQAFLAGPRSTFARKGKPRFLRAAWRRTARRPASARRRRGRGPPGWQPRPPTRHPNLLALNKPGRSYDHARRPRPQDRVT